MGKNPAFQFYPSDWSRDLEEHPLEIEGAWIRICCKLWWSDTRGELTRTWCQWAKILRVDEHDAKRIIEYIKTWKIGDVVIDCNGNVTVISRRMKNDEKERIINNERRMKHYYKSKCNAECNADVTPVSQRSSSSSSSSNKEKKINKEKKESDFRLPEWIPRESWDGFVESRKKQKPLTDRAKHLIIKKLIDLRVRGHDPGVLLDEAVEKGWMSVYEPKSQAVSKHGGNGSGYSGRYASRNRIPEPVERETEEAIERINRMARAIAEKSSIDKTKPDA